MKKVLLVYAHPEPRSLNGALRQVTVETLRALGHEVLVSDLYAMGWNPVADATDFLDMEAGARLSYGRDSRRAHDAGQLAPDIAAEQAKILAADALILQFPLWWFAPPAILKGWIDRVFCNGFAYGLTAPGVRYSLRYGDGRLAGKRALVSVTAGGQEPHFSGRGVNGAIGDLLFPLTHGTLWYAGMDVLEPFTVLGANRVPDEQYADAAATLKQRLAGLFTDAPIRFRKQGGGDYDEDLRLKPGVEGARTGLSH